MKSCFESSRMPLLLVPTFSLFANEMSFTGLRVKDLTMLCYAFLIMASK